MQLFRRAKSEVSCFVSSYPEFYLLIFSKISAAGSAMEEADVHGMGACAGIALSSLDESPPVVLSSISALILSFKCYQVSEERFLTSLAHLQEEEAP